VESGRLRRRVLAIAAVPVSMAVAILKYRLYDIDRIISGTVAYTIITSLLVGVYAGLVLLATQVFGFHSAVAVAAATLKQTRVTPRVSHQDRDSSEDMAAPGGWADAWQSLDGAVRDGPALSLQPAAAGFPS
jgi:hypothetical protein